MTTDGAQRIRLGGDLFHPVVPDGAVRVSRPTRWANPFPVGRYGLMRALELHRDWLRGAPGAVDEARASGCRLRCHGPSLVAAVRRELAGRSLACWCPLEHPCHGDLLLAVAASAPGEPVPALMWRDAAAAAPRRSVGHGEPAGRVRCEPP